MFVIATDQATILFNSIFSKINQFNESFKIRIYFFKNSSEYDQTPKGDNFLFTKKKISFLFNMSRHGLAYVPVKLLAFLNEQVHFVFLQIFHTLLYNYFTINIH